MRVVKPESVWPELVAPVGPFSMSSANRMCGAVASASSRAMPNVGLALADEGAQEIHDVEDRRGPASLGAAVQGDAAESQEWLPLRSA